MNITVIVAAHKKYRMPQDPCYLPLHVGRAGKADLGYAGDDTGENISEKNPYYCELTGLYWLWKNSNADYKGLVHYRRHFAGGKAKTLEARKDRFAGILTQAELEGLLKENDILLPKKRNYYIETVYSHYAHTHYAQHLDLTGEIIRRQCPAFSAAFDRVMGRTCAHMFNMMVMSREKFDAYCAWLFPVLEELEGLVDYKRYDAFQARLFGRVSELLLDVWLEQTGYPYKELPVLPMEQTNWLRKGFSFLLAKFRGKKYRTSF